MKTMTAMKKLTIVIVALFLALLPTACRKEKPLSNKQFTFNATIEQPKGDDDSKVYLENEHLIIWEYDDEISIGSNMTTTGSDHYRAWLLAANGENWIDYNGVFLTELPDGSKYFLGLHPSSESNYIQSTGGTDFTVRINLPSVQTYRSGDKGDFTFDKQMLPMVAWYGGEWDADPYTPFNLDFHSVAAIVRLQFVNKTGAATTLNNIVITSADDSKKQLCGLFNVNGYKTFDPSLTAAANTAANQTVTINCGSLEFPQNSIKTFYLILPAIAGRETTTSYKLTATVNTAAGSSSRTFTANTRRNGLTYMQALEISDWSSTPAASISGNGTVDRPFKVYTIEDLTYLRECYNAAEPPAERYINGQPITADTYIKIMRTDIVLDKDNWNTGIRHFVGHMTAMDYRTNPGIVDSCNNAPLFQSIDAGGVVEGITLKCGAYFSSSSASGVSPFCYSNAGTIRNCVTTTIPGKPKTLTSASAALAGICVNNTGIIDGCRFEGSAKVEEGHNFAGICMNNQSGGVIKGCQISATTPAMTLTFTEASSKVAGICFSNEAGCQVKDCYFATTITGSANNWGGIVYNNSGTVEHCYLSRTGHIYTSGRVGGIVKNNAGVGSTVNYCWLEGQLRGNMVGGIVDSLGRGRVINCFNDGSDAIITTTTSSSAAGGIACQMIAGSIENCYVNGLEIMYQADGSTFGGIVGRATGGTIRNCYAIDNRNLFYGSTTGVTYTGCYLIDGNQAEVTTYEEDRTYNALSGYLQAGASSITGAKGWQHPTPGEPPILEGYTSSSSKRRH